MEYEPLLRKRLFEGIVDRIKAQIKSGQLSPGDQLPAERELAEKMSVSRTSVREALRTLEIMGYIEIKAGEGVFVKQVTFDDLLEPIMGALSVDKDLILDLLDVRDIIEVEMTKKAVMNASEEDLSRIENAIVNAEAEVQAGGVGLEGDNNFHAA